MPRAFAEATVHRRKLANGLTALVREDHSAPVVAIVTQLKVGYFDEPDELAGISHVLEHMFFKGTTTRGPGQISQETKAAGGYLNASTIYDHTNYYTVLPSSSLETGLAIQSDALINSVIDADELRRELQVIIQEAKRKLDNADAFAVESLYELMFDRHRMRRWRIGTEAFLNQLTREQLCSYYRSMYRGGSTVLVVAGDVDPDRTHALIERYYADLAPGETGRDRGPDEPARQEFRYREHAGDILRAYLELGWHTIPALHQDTPALDLLSLVLGQGRASRLYRNVRETGVVTGISARHYTPTELGVFQVNAELRAENAASALEAIAGTIAGALERIDRAELERAQSITDARAIRRLESMDGQANVLAEWEMLGDWQLGDEYLERIASATVADLQRVARRYLEPGAGAVLFYRPRDDSPLSLTADQLSARMRASAAVGVAQQETAAAPQPRKASSVRRTNLEDGVYEYTDSAGLRIVIKPRRSMPLVSVAIAAAGGANRETPATAGLTGLVARTSIKGTRRRNAAGLAMEAEALGATVSPTVTSDLFDWFISVPARHFETALELIADAALEPTFPDAEFEREKQVALADLQQLRDDMYRYPMRLLQQTVFAGHPYGFPIEASEAAIAKATASNVRDWHARTVHQAMPYVCIVGAVDPEQAAAAVGRMVHVNTGALPEGRAPTWGGGKEIVKQRDKAQTALVVGFPAVDRNHPDITALQLLSNAVAGLGGRLFEELRSRRSLAYTVAAYPIARQLGGAFIGYIGTSPDREDEARSALLEEFERMREERLPEDELERAKQFTIGTWHIRAQTNVAQLSDLMNALLIGEGLREIREYEARVQAVSTETIRDVAQRYFDPARMTQAVVRGTGGGR